MAVCEPTTDVDASGSGLQDSIGEEAIDEPEAARVPSLLDTLQPAKKSTLARDRVRVTPGIRKKSCY